MIRVSLFAAVSLCGLAGVAGAQNDRYAERIDTAVTIDRPGYVSVSVHSGRVTVRGVPGSRVRVRGSAERGELKVDATETSVRVEVEPQGRRGGHADLEVTVPTGTRVVVESHSAIIAVHGVKGEVKAASLSGGIEITDAVGKVTAESVSGGVAVSKVAGDIRVESVSGRLEMTDVSGDIDGETVSGRIWITGATSKSVRAESVSGRLGYSGTIDQAGNYVFRSHSGTLSLGLPSNAGATVSLETFSGSVDSDFPVTLQPGATRRDHDNKFEFRIGNGRARIIAETFSGSIRIQRGANRDNQE